MPPRRHEGILLTRVLPEEEFALLRTSYNTSCIFVHEWVEVVLSHKIFLTFSVIKPCRICQRLFIAPSCSAKSVLSLRLLSTSWLLICSTDWFTKSTVNCLQFKSILKPLQKKRGKKTIVIFHSPVQRYIDIQCSLLQLYSNVVEILFRF